MDAERLHGVVHGDVQGVGFRWFLMRKATQLGLRGWVRNRDDGTVEFVAEGRRSELEQLRRAAEHGPAMARVARVDDDWSPAAGGLDDFDLTG
ncbi:acylphosphatase [bacterium]|nr:MAG: acylphosphatase [bacterium]